MRNLKDRQYIYLPVELKKWLQQESQDRQFSTTNAYITRALMYIKDHNIKV